MVNNLRHFYGMDMLYIGHVVGPGGHCTCHFVFGVLKMALMELLLNFSGNCLRSVFLKCRFSPCVYQGTSSCSAVL